MYGPATQRLVPSGNHGYIYNLGRSPSGTSSCVENSLGERDVHAARLANPCLVCGMHSYGKRTEEPGVARRSRS